ncbi:pyridoxal phosphate-dependent aminotransferase [Solicola gregarius]|uniref:Pyridoxal phosphate-dependent aminotransferase n=1 Tax=Solicola gregarius TaxID=2908642 RepID=A0AA46YJJ2_9ACTN|nr:pyridoxal phosphate-dependent aminotransferase [Solicola gregarius]UYM03644.1 pyridoxal phosphate-dependent aminotransferase [Solicola gregarius]
MSGLGAPIIDIDWLSTLYVWLDNTLYVAPDGTHVGDYELSSGTNQLTPPRLFTDALRAFGPRQYWEMNTYSGPLGDDQLRDAVATYENSVNGWSIGRDNVVVTYGAHEGVQIALRSLPPSGRRALVLGPQVPLIFQALLQQGFSFRELWGEQQHELVPSTDRVLDTIAACHPDVVVLTSPNNPTGDTYAPDELDAIGAAVIDRGGHLVVDKILSDSCLPGSSMVDGTSHQMGEWIVGGRCLVVDSLSKRRAISGLRTGYLLAAEDVVARHSMIEIGGCPPLLLAAAAADDLTTSARIHAGAHNAGYAGLDAHDVAHGDDLQRMRSTVEHNFEFARDALGSHWAWDSKRPGCFNCVVGIHVDPALGDDRERCEMLFTEAVSCYPLSTFAADPRLVAGRTAGLLELRLTCAAESVSFAETIARTKRALDSSGHHA